ncbi:MAG TPA: hypothetical protein PKJ99_09875 [Thermoanaerobaculales bacterium]|nr:hypothetical protein [Thermoanaerobaculales bacterium]HQL29590.1 hypothetical protein [Thermoanaerobaculales bacterium]HQP44366.1 hypothetical protein [Thermoanaerobaculales bacterium]
MSARAVLIVLAALLVPAVAPAGPPEAAALLDGMLQAAGGIEAFRDLGVLEIALTEEETTADGTPHSRRATAYLDARTLSSLRLELPGDVVVARHGGNGWSTRAGAPDERPQASRMAVGTLNQRLFPLLLPFTATMEGVRLGAVNETSFEGVPAWRVAVSFPEGFFIAPSMSTTWYLHIRKDSGALLAAEFLPPPSVREVRSEGIRYRVLKHGAIGAGTQLPVQVLLDGIDLNGSPTGHVRITKMQVTVRGPFDPSLFLHPLELQALEDRMD